MQRRTTSERGLRHWLADFLQPPADESPRHAELDPTRGRRIDWRVAVVLITAALMLTFRDEQYRLSYFAALDLVRSLENLVPGLLGGLTETLTADENLQLTRLCYWSVWQFIVYVVVPLLVVKVVLRERWRDYGLKVRGMLNYWWVYLGMYLTILPAVLLLSTTASFQRTYPFYNLGADESLWPRFWIWQLFYSLQFISLEIFFRGFIVHGTKRQLGIYSIFVMMIPYCMIHFGKPLPETIGAIIAGIVLGFMSLKTRSVWLGAASHISVALTMDFAALVQRG